MPDDKLFEILKIRSDPGVLVFDLQGRLLFSNQKAQDLPPLLRTREPGRVPPLEEILDLFLPPGNADFSLAEGANDTLHTILSDLHGVTHAVRAFPIGDNSDGSGATHLLVLIERVVDHRRIVLDATCREFKLTKREKEVVALVYRGLTNREIADKVFISEHTVKVHLKNIMKKMEVNSRQEICALLI
jgi:DNA-binding CsgD family transcriptional regulator